MNLENNDQNAATAPLSDKNEEKKLLARSDIKMIETKPKRKAKNVFNYMESAFETKAPQSLLYKSIQESRRIKVWTRSHSYVRSICTGYLLAFDRFMNLAMIDVDEVYRVPLNKLNQTSNKIINTLTSNLENVSLEKNEKSQKKSADHLNEEVAVNLNLYKSGRYNLFQRHVNQMLIRGDNVVFVVLAD